MIFKVFIYKCLLPVYINTSKFLILTSCVCTVVSDSLPFRGL